MKATVSALLVALVAPAHAQERIWIGSAHDDGASLVYGTPESGDLALSFDCAKGSDALAFSYAFEPVNATDGVKVEVTLQAGDIIVPIETIGARLEMDDLFVLEGQTKLDNRFVDLITSSGILQIFVEDGSEEIPLDGAREAAESLTRTCRIG